MKKVLIFMEGGVIHQVLKTDEDIQVIIIDEDTDGVEEDELTSAQEIEELMELKGESWIDEGFDFFVSEEPISVSFK